MSLQSCLTLCDPIDGSSPGSPIPGILQARTLEWVAISFSNAWKWKVKGKSLSRVRPSETPWPAAYKAPPSMGFSRQEYWSGVPSPSPLGSRTEAYSRNWPHVPPGFWNCCRPVTIFPPLSIRGSSMYIPQFHVEHVWDINNFVYKSSEGTIPKKPYLNLDLIR